MALTDGFLYILRKEFVSLTLNEQDEISNDILLDLEKFRHPIDQSQ